MAARRRCCRQKLSGDDRYERFGSDEGAPVPRARQPRTDRSPRSGRAGPLGPTLIELSRSRTYYGLHAPSRPEGIHAV